MSNANSADKSKPYSHASNELKQVGAYDSLVIETFQIDEVRGAHEAMESNRADNKIWFASEGVQGETYGLVDASVARFAVSCGALAMSSLLCAVSTDRHTAPTTCVRMCPIQE
jgi:hypothetical protein